MAPLRRRQGDPPPDYGPNTEEFSLEVHYGGYICGIDSKLYIDEKVSWFDFCEVDTWSLLWIEDFAEQLGYQKDVQVKAYWLPPGKTLSNGLRRIKGDADTNCMVSFIPKYTTLVIYLDEIGVLEGVEWDDFQDIVSTPQGPLGLSPLKSEGGEQFSPLLPIFLKVNNASPKRSKRLSVLPSLSDELKGHIVDTGSEDEETRDDPDFVDSDYEVDAGDDDLFEKYVDNNDTKENDKPSEEHISEYVSSEEDLFVADSKEDIALKNKFKVFRPKSDMAKPEFKVGMVFASMAELRNALHEYSVQQRVAIETPKNDSDRLRAICAQGCSWQLFASPDSRVNGIMVKSYVGKHSCHKRWDNKWFTSRYIANKYLETIRAMPKVDITEIGRLVQKDFNMTASRTKLYRAKWIALKIIYGDELEQYNKLWDYGNEIRKANPGSIFYLCLEDSRFSTLYVSFDACKRGFLMGCRPLIFLDGTHIKTKYGGQLLVAVGMDGNDCIFPIAMAVVGIENKKTWKWFLQTLKEDLRISNTAHWTLMGDKQKGLIQAMREEFPDAEHRFCVRHLYQNFQVMFKGEELKNQLWACARSASVSKWTMNMQKLKELDKEAYEWLEELPPTEWCRAFFREFPQCDILLNNNCEVFNRWILDARKEPVLTMMESIRRKLMTRFYNNYTTAVEKWSGVLCPKIAAKLQKNADLANTCYALPSSMGIFEVTNKDHKCVVHLLDRKCDCRRWQLTGIPCYHAISCLRSERKTPEDEVHECYHIATYLKAYGNRIVPPRDSTQWDNTNGPPVNPPLYDKKPGRPRMSRKKQPHEVPGKNKMSKHGVTIHCSYCKQPNHNKKGCSLKKAGIKATVPMKRKALEMHQDQQGEEEPAKTQLITQEQTTSVSSQLPMCAFITQNYSQITTQSGIGGRAPLPESTFISNVRHEASDVPCTTASRKGREVLKKAKVVRSKKKATTSKKK